MTPRTVGIRKIRIDREFLPANARYREPQVGETLVCKRNDYRVSDEVFNGQLWTVNWVEPDSVRTSDGVIPILRLSLRNDYGRTEVCVQKGYFNGGAELLCAGCSISNSATRLLFIPRKEANGRKSSSSMKHERFRVRRDNGCTRGSHGL